MEPQMHRSTDKTRAGSTPHIVRYVLIISTAVAAIAMTLVLLWGKAISPEDAGGSTSTAERHFEEPQSLPGRPDVIEGVKQTPPLPDNAVQQAATGNTEP